MEEISARTSSARKSSPPTTPPRSSSPNSIIKEGFLTKKGHLRRNWKTRWFVLQPGSLSYSKGPGTSAKRTIILEDPIDVTVIESQGNHPNREFCILLNIKSKNSEFLIDCETETEMKSWVKEIRQVLKKKINVTWYPNSQCKCKCKCKIHDH